MEPIKELPVFQGTVLTSPVEKIDIEGKIGAGIGGVVDVVVDTVAIDKNKITGIKIACPTKPSGTYE
jgi:hypothetical protein